MARPKLLAVLALAGYSIPAGISYTPASLAVAVHCRTRHTRALSLSFDDGPQPGATERFLERLSFLNVRATFFMVGEQVKRFPSLVAEVSAAGHEIGNHGYRHRNHFFRSPVDVIRDVELGAEVIAEVTGKRPDLFRPPQGVVTAATRYAAYRSKNAVVLWTSWGRDWRRQATAKTIKRDALMHIGPGSVILLHDSDYYSGRSWTATYDAIEPIVMSVRARGLDPVPIGGKAKLA